MATIHTIGGKEHRQTQLVLPWYATGRLDAAERSAVEDHLAHCAACREDLQVEREMAVRVAGLAIDAEAGWTGIQQQLTARVRPRRGEQLGEAIRHWLAWPGKFGWFLAGQALAAGLVLFLALPRTPSAEYHTLGARPAHAPGNVIVIFRPDTSEADFRAALVASRAKIVDGPTASGAYVLRVAADERGAILSELRQRKSIILAQPIDADSDQ